MTHPYPLSGGRDMAEDRLCDGVFSSRLPEPSALPSRTLAQTPEPPQNPPPDPVTSMSELLPPAQVAMRTDDRQAASKAEFEVLYKADFALLCRFLRYLGAPADRVNDLAQECYIDLWRSWGTVREPGPWLRVVARRKYARELEAMARQARPTSEDAWQADGALTPADNADEAATVRAVLRGLPATQREVIALATDGYRTADIAALLGMNDNAVRQALHRARTRLKKDLASYLGDRDDRLRGRRGGAR